MGSLADRLTQLMDEAGVNQAELAEAVQASPAAVSAWCRGRKRPGRANLAAIARRLGTTAAWLEYGESSHGEEHRNLGAERRQYGEALDWYFQEPRPDAQRILGNAAEYAFTGNFRTLARETAQNSLDERRRGEVGIDMRFTVIELEGDHLTSFLDVLKWDKLQPHLQAAAAGPGEKTQAVIRAGLKRLESEARMLLLRIEDFNTNGLIGPEYDSGQFMAVARNVLDSQKSGNSAGGSYGLGKSAMWAVSSFGLVLMNSTLSIAEEGQRNDRFFGRLELPWREVEKQPYAGPGWLGQWDERKDHACTCSIFGNAALAHDAYMDREGGSGTTFLVVAAYDPSGEAEDVEQIAEELRRSLAENFWPAMVPRMPSERALLNARVRTQRGREVTSDHLVDPAEYVPELVDLLRRHHDDAVVDQLDAPGDVVRTTVPLSLPGRAEEPEHGPVTHEAVLLVGQAEDPDSKWADRVEFLRGNRMIVWDDRVRPLPLGSRPFHAVVLAGEAAGESEADVHAERFLRAAEPPAHHTWEATPDVTSHYARGGPTAINNFKHEVRESIRSIVGVQTKELSDGPDALKELLRIAPPTGETHTKPRVKRVVGGPNDDDAWDVEVLVTIPPKSKGWQFAPVLKFATESGPSLGVEWSEVISVSDCEVADEKRWLLKVKPGSRTATFRGITNPESHPVSARRAKAIVDLRDVHPKETS